MSFLILIAKKYWFGICAAFSVVSLILILFYDNQTIQNQSIKPIQSQDGLYCSEPYWHAGVVTIGPDSQEISHPFTLVNNSKLPIQIAEVKTSCGCLVGSGYDSTIEPGLSTVLIAKYTPPAQPTEFSRAITIVTGNGSKLELLVGATVSVSSGIFCHPDNLNFGTVEPGGVKTRRLVLERYDHSPLAISKIESTHPYLSVLPFSPELTESSGSYSELKSHDTKPIPIPYDKALNQFSFDLQFKPKEVVADFQAMIRVYSKSEVTSSDIHMLDIPVSGTIVAHTSPYLKSILVRNLRPDEIREVIITADGSRIMSSSVSSFTYEGSDELLVECNKLQAEHIVTIATRKHNIDSMRVLKGTLTIYGTDGSKHDLLITAFTSSE